MNFKIYKSKARYWWRDSSRRMPAMRKLDKISIILLLYS
nr:MAG TPA: hypothetical protein [Caudoviricetes sp.]